MILRNIVPLDTRRHLLSYTKHVYQHSKHCVGVGVVSRGSGERCCRGKKQPP